MSCELSTFRDEKKPSAIHVLSAADGSTLWSRDYVPGASHTKQARGMFAGELLWILDEKNWLGLDPRSGAVKKKYPPRPTHCFPPEPHSIK